MDNPLERRFERRFIVTDTDMGDWPQVEPFFSALEARPLGTRGELEAWLLDVSELAACLSEEESGRYVAMTCRTDDAEAEARFLHFIEEIQPRCKPRWQRLRERYVASPARKALAPERYAVYDRSTATAVEIFREENVPLQTEDQKLDQQYQKICGAMTVEYEGKEQTLQQMARYQQQPDRAVREETWKLVVGRRLREREALDGLFDRMIALRTEAARNAGFDHYRDYRFKELERFDYTPGDCAALHDAIEAVGVPAYRGLQRERRVKLGVDRLRPWDLSVDPMGRAPLRPFEKVETLSSGCSTIFHRIDPALGEQFDAMAGAGWLDLENRKGKAPGGYQCTFDAQRRPFIFMNAVGLHRDVETLLHEGGHAFHALACREEPLMTYRHCGMEMAEVASMSMELFAYEHLDVFYQGDELARARREQLEGIVQVFPWIATIDAFQHWLYTHPDHTHDERTAAWLSLLERFGGIEDWTGHEAAREAMWQRQLHLFGVPLYYVEYGIAQIGALQLWQKARRDRAAALSGYQAALALGGSCPLPELWAAAGLRFDFSRETLEPLIRAVLDELKTLDETADERSAGIARNPSRPHAKAQRRKG